VDDREKLIALAEKARRLAADVFDAQPAAELLKLAQEYEGRIMASGSVAKPSEDQS
jgi:hypothetical protein